MATTSTTTTATTTTTTPLATSNLSDATSTVVEQWPCANCHSLVSDDRCPFCNGIQVKLKNKHNQEESILIRNTLGAWIERVSPATVRGSTPQSCLFSQKHDNNNINNLFWQNISPDINNDLLDEEELEQTSSTTSFFDVTSSPSSSFGIENNKSFESRPNNPVAFLLSSAAVVDSPSPKPFSSDANHYTKIMNEQGQREELKRKSKDRVTGLEELTIHSSPTSTNKKQRILFTA